MSRPKRVWTCIRCGAPTFPNRAYCDCCRNKRRSEVWEVTRKAKKNEKKQMSFLDIVKAADAAGMSYGKYCLKYGI